jgi:hypothetical protein
MNNIKFNIYYSLSPDGPWTLDNDTPLDRVSTGNTYQISSLSAETLYYIRVVGGVIEDDEFVPLISQPITITKQNAGDVNNVIQGEASTRTFGPRFNDTSSLSHEFTIDGILEDSILAHQFTMELSVDSILSHQFAVEIEADSLMGHQFTVTGQDDFWLLGTNNQGQWQEGGTYANLTGTITDTTDIWLQSRTPGTAANTHKLEVNGIACNVDHPRTWIAVGERIRSSGSQGDSIIAVANSRTLDYNGTGEWFGGASPWYVYDTGLPTDGNTDVAQFIFHDGTVSGLFLVGLDNGRMWYTQTGRSTDWNDGGQPSDAALYGGTYHSTFDRYTVVGANGSNGPIYTSTDGMSWTHSGIAGAGTTQLNCAAQSVAAGLLVVAGAGGTILKSTDGLTWTSVGISSPTANAIYDIVYEPLRAQWFICGGVGGVGEIHWSSDLSSWSSATGLERDIYSITHDGAGIVLAAGGLAGVGNVKDNLWLTEYPGTSFSGIITDLSALSGTIRFQVIANSATVPRT